MTSDDTVLDRFPAVRLDHLNKRYYQGLLRRELLVNRCRACVPPGRGPAAGGRRRPAAGGRRRSRAVTGRNPARDKVAIAGVGLSPYARGRGGTTELTLLLEAAVAAIRDAGLTAADIDGV